jgi:hypothetical protein
MLNYIAHGYDIFNNFSKSAIPGVISMGIPNPGVPGLSSVTAVCITRIGDGVALS